MLMAVNERTLKMGSAPIFPLLVSMAVPGLLGTLTTYLYRTVDQIFVGNILPLGDIFNGDEAAGMIVSQVKHQPQSITSFGRDFHKHTSFQKLDIILLLVY